VCIYPSLDSSLETRDNHVIVAKTKRGYSRDYRPHGNSGKRYLLDKIPAGLWTSVREKAAREGVSLRALILSLLKDWVKTP
jgi:hypothetical protein